MLIAGAAASTTRAIIETPLELAKVQSSSYKYLFFNDFPGTRYKYSWPVEMNWVQFQGVRVQSVPILGLTLGDVMMNSLDFCLLSVQK